MLALKYDGLAKHTEVLEDRTNAVAGLTAGYGPAHTPQATANTRQH